METMASEGGVATAGGTSSGVDQAGEPRTLPGRVSSLTRHPTQWALPRQLPCATGQALTGWGGSGLSGQQGSGPLTPNLELS